MEMGAIYMDDSGNPGADSHSDFLPKSRRSWTAVIVPSTVASDVRTAMTIFCKGVLDEARANELHFVDIYGGVGPWKSIRPDRRASIIDLMAELMRLFALPIIHQTVSHQTLADYAHLRHYLDHQRAGDWMLDDLSQLCFLMTSFEVANRLRSLKNACPRDFELPFRLYADEGIMPANRNRPLPECSDVIEDSQVHFRRSSDIAGLQLADFAAFAMMRSQWVAIKHEEGSPIRQADDVILRAAASLNVLNLPLHLIPTEKFGRQSYEAGMMKDRISKGLFPRPDSE